MKLRFYMDIVPGSIYANGYWATTNPGGKSEYSRRIAFDVTVPDHMLQATPDFVAPEVGPAVEVRDGDE